MILYGERLVSGPRADHAARALLNVAGRLKLAGARDGAGPAVRARRAPTAAAWARSACCPTPARGSSDAGA